MMCVLCGCSCWHVTHLMLSKQLEPHLQAAVQQQQALPHLVVLQ
jgi:hypothetical protein